MSAPRCKTPRCRNPRRRDGRDCHACAKRGWRERRPFHSAYATLRDHAREERKPFTISFDYFLQFALQSDYVARTGLCGGCLTVDRIDNLRGYEPGNIQPLTRSENCLKQAKRDAVRMRAGFSWRAAA